MLLFNKKDRKIIYMKDKLMWFWEKFGFAIGLIVTVVVLNIRLPYVVYTPGNTISLNDRINIEDSNDMEGSFNAVSVLMRYGNLPNLLMSLVVSNWDLVPYEEIKSDDVSMKEMFERDKILMDNSVNNAAFAVFDLLNIPYEIDEELYVVLQSRSDSNILVGDYLLEVEGKKVTDLDMFLDIINTKKIGDEIEVLVLRDDKEVLVNGELFDIGGEAKLGISIATLYDYASDIVIDFESDKNESGPSAGLMMALTMYNMIEDKDITYGKKIVGTGTIDKDGVVGDIGGVKYKLLGAVKNDAELFICPSGNYEEAMEVKKDNDLDIDIIKATTLESVIKQLEELYE